MAHSVATGAIGGGYGPYSVRLPFIADIINIAWLTPVILPL